MNEDELKNTYNSFNNIFNNIFEMELRVQEGQQLEIIILKAKLNSELFELNAGQSIIIINKYRDLFEVFNLKIKNTKLIIPEFINEFLEEIRDDLIYWNHVAYFKKTKQFPNFVFNVKLIRRFAFDFRTISHNDALKFLADIIHKMRTFDDLKIPEEDITLVKGFYNEINDFTIPQMSNELRKIHPDFFPNKYDDNVTKKTKQPKIEIDKSLYRFIKGDLYNPGKMEIIYNKLKDNGFIQCSQFQFFDILENGEPIIWLTSVADLYLLIYLLKNEFNYIKIPKITSHPGIPAILESGKQFLLLGNEIIPNVSENARDVRILIKEKKFQELDKKKLIIYKFLKYLI